jgi:hypothetical protein
LSEEKYGLFGIFLDLVVENAHLKVGVIVILINRQSFPEITIESVEAVCAIFRCLLFETSSNAG